MVWEDGGREAPSYPIVACGFTDYLVGIQILHQTDITGRHELTFAIVPDVPRPNLGTSTGADWLLQAFPSEWNKIGNFMVGQGSPGYTIGYDSVPRNALIVNCVPEPAGLVLLALGVLAGLRSRR